MENNYIISGGQSYGSEYLEEKYVYWRITLNWISSKENVRVWIGSRWPRGESSAVTL
jgi:hypothetical protein